MKNTFVPIKLQKVVTMVYDLLGVFDGSTSIKSQKGVTLIEYSLIAGLIAVAAVSTLTTVGSDVNKLFVAIAGKIPVVIP